MVDKAIRAAVVASMMLAAPCVRAQDVPKQPSTVAAEPIVVEGHSIASDEKVRALTRAISPRARYSQPLARFTDPVCFAAVGLPAPMLRTIGYRLADDAQAAGVRLAGDRCDANIVILFVEDAQSELQSILARQPTLFRDKQPSEIRAIMDEPGPAKVWNISEVRSGDGDRLYQTVNGPPRLNIPKASRIGPMVRSDLLSTVMLIDRKAVVGHS